MTSSRRAARPALALLTLLLSAALIALAAGPGLADDPLPPRAPQARDYTQTITFRVMDGLDRPVAGAVITLRPEQGHPLDGQRLTTDAWGQAVAHWQPAVRLLAGVHDKVFDVVTTLGYSVEAPKSFPAAGRIVESSRGRHMAEAELKHLNQEPVLRPLTELVVLRRLNEALSGELLKMKPGSPLVKQVVAFHRDMAPVLTHLGLAFAWPAFGLDQGRLTLALDWRGGSWAGLAMAPLTAQVTAGALLPMARAVGEELASAPGVKEVRLVVLGEISPPGDPHALPAPARMSLTAPLASYLDLAQGRLSPDQLLRRHPPRTKVGEAPPERGMEQDS